MHCKNSWGILIRFYKCAFYALPVSLRFCAPAREPTLSLRGRSLRSNSSFLFPVCPAPALKHRPCHQLSGCRDVKRASVYAATFDLPCLFSRQHSWYLNSTVTDGEEKYLLNWTKSLIADVLWLLHTPCYLTCLTQCVVIKRWEERSALRIFKETTRPPPLSKPHNVMVLYRQSCARTHESLAEWIENWSRTTGLRGVCGLLHFNAASSSDWSRPPSASISLIRLYTVCLILKINIWDELKTENNHTVQYHSQTNVFPFWVWVLSSSSQEDSLAFWIWKCYRYSISSVFRILLCVRVTGSCKSVT